MGFNNPIVVDHLYPLSIPNRYCYRWIRPECMARRIGSETNPNQFKTGHHAVKGVNRNAPDLTTSTTSQCLNTYVRYSLY